ncbi:hypothetical protein T492DRAFT_588898, partial [Pavlovales sp. CCMP2436]
QIRARHLLIKHEGSRNPLSRRTNLSTANLSRNDALAELKIWQGKVQRGVISLEAAARQRSDCASFQDGGEILNYISCCLL